MIKCIFLLNIETCDECDFKDGVCDEHFFKRYGRFKDE